jgi:hypothetical protein
MRSSRGTRYFNLQPRRGYAAGDDPERFQVRPRIGQSGHCLLVAGGVCHLDLPTPLRYAVGDERRRRSLDRPSLAYRVPRDWWLAVLGQSAAALSVAGQRRNLVADFAVAVEERRHNVSVFVFLAVVQ